MTAFALLRTERLTKAFGGVAAVKDISLTITAGNIHAIIGPNGSGKSTFLNLVSGVYIPTSGTIVFADHQIAGADPHVIARHGVVRTFQNLRLFRDLTVLDNVKLGAQWRGKGNILGAVCQTRAWKAEEAKIEENAWAACKKLGVEMFADAKAGSLSYGQQRRVEIARALAAEPKILLVDEPVAGMNTAEATDLSERFREIREQGVTILLIEHNMRFVMALANHITVFDHGEKLFEGSPVEVQGDQRVIDVYLGKAHVVADRD